MDDFKKRVITYVEPSTTMEIGGMVENGKRFNICW